MTRGDMIVYTSIYLAFDVYTYINILTHKGYVV